MTRMHRVMLAFLLAYATAPPYLRREWLARLNLIDDRNT